MTQTCFQLSDRQRLIDRRAWLLLTNEITRSIQPNVYHLDLRHLAKWWNVVVGELATLILGTQREWREVLDFSPSLNLTVSFRGVSFGLNFVDDQNISWTRKFCVALQKENISTFVPRYVLHLHIVFDTVSYLINTVKIYAIVCCWTWVLIHGYLKLCLINVISDILFSDADDKHSNLY